ncbi:uncharacterized protein PG998_004918 [Apiospora kogelbergensis]|uniref:uncharacterized protein n=1 Tax=Apiospora kogelbergensis TaxID=1337665 RepID=UPI00312D3997
MVLPGSNMFRRGTSTQTSEDVEAQRDRRAPEMVESGGGQQTQSTTTRTRRLSLRLPRFPSGGRRTGNNNENGNGGGHEFSRTRADNNGFEPGEIESPKSPRFNINLTNMPSTRLHLPNLARTWTRGSSGPPTQPPSPHDFGQQGGDGGGGPMSSMQEARPRPSMQQQQQQQQTQPELLPVVEEPQPARTRSNEQRSSFMRRFRGADPAELHLADMADRGRQRTRRHGHTNGSSSGRHSDPASGHQPPKRFLYCFPWVKSRRVRNQILRCFVSGMLLISSLAVYLALSLTKNITNSEFTILLILIILATTIFFCHGLIKLCLFVMRPQTAEEQERARLPNMFGPGGYAIPRRPIRVVLARDEEAAGLESETNKLQPPAYGLWRESVRVDPNRIYWARNEQSPPRPPTSGTRGTAEGEEGSNSHDNARPTTARPPSYASEDGVAYVVEARPRSMAPLTDVPLQPHPSEAETMPHRPAW